MNIDQELENDRLTEEFNTYKEEDRKTRGDE
jgi:hypothetical protein